MPVNFNFTPLQYPDIGKSLDSVFDYFLQNKIADRNWQVQQQQMQRDQQQMQLQQQQMNAMQAQGMLQGAPFGINFNDPNQVQQGLDQRQQFQQKQRDMWNQGIQGPTSSPIGQMGQGIDSYINQNQAMAALNMQKLGDESGLTRAKAYEAFTQGQKNLSEAQLGPQPAQSEFAARGFADKAIQADNALDSLVSSGFDPSAKMGTIASLMPNQMKSDSRQKFEQTQRQFVNAILRRESGAAIPESELKNYTRQYFPMAGDGKDVIAQKSQARKLAIKNLNAEARRVPSEAGNLPAMPEVPQFKTASGFSYSVVK